MEHFFWLKSGNLFVLLAEQAKNSPSLFVTLIPMVLMFARGLFHPHAPRTTAAVRARDHARQLEKE